VSRLVGAPPGYVGYEEGGQLTEAVRRRPYAIVLLDEIEKAHPDVFNVLLQVLDDGRLTDNKGRVVNFKNTIIIMTSNIGASIIQENLEGLTSKNYSAILQKTKSMVFETLKQSVRPEFLNRIDETIMFNPLNKYAISKIVKIHLEKVAELLVEKDISITATDYAIEYLSEKGYEPQFGARPIKRVIQKEILNALSRKLISGEIKNGENILVDSFENTIVFRNEKNKKS